MATHVNVSARVEHSRLPVVGAVIAHQGGWDEILLVLGPILVIVGLLRRAKRRADRQPPADPHD